MSFCPRLEAILSAANNTSAVYNVDSGIEESSISTSPTVAVLSNNIPNKKPADQTTIPYQTIGGGRKFEGAYVSHVDHPSSIFVQLPKYGRQFQNLHQTMNAYYRNSEFNPSVRYRRGDFCVAKYSKDGEYYRARIGKIDMKKDGLEKYCVIYVDFGNSEWTLHDNIRILRQEFSLLEAQAIPCSLDRISPIMDANGKYSWQTDVGQGSARYLISLLDSYNNTVTVTFLQKDVPSWHLNIVILHVRDGPFKERVFICILYPLKKMSFFSVRSEEFQRARCKTSLARSVDGVLAIAPRLIRPIQTGNNSTIGNWNDDEKIVDTSQKPKTHQSSLAECIPERPSTAVFEIIDQYESSTISNHSTETKSKIISDYSFSTRQCENISQCDSGRLSSQTLNDQNLRKKTATNTTATTDSGRATEIDSQATTSSQLVEQYEQFIEEPICIAYQLIEPYQQFNSAFVSHIDHPTSIFIQLPKTGIKFQELHQKMNYHYRTYEKETIPTLLKAGDFCIAIYSKDSEYYRARILKVNQENRIYCIVFVDFGNSEWTLHDNIRILREEFSLLEAQAIPCSLNRIIPCQMSADDIKLNLKNKWHSQVGKECTEKLKELVLEKQVIVTFLPKESGYDWPLHIIEINIPKRPDYFFKDIGLYLENTVYAKYSGSNRVFREELFPKFGQTPFEKYLYGLPANRKTIILRDCSIKSSLLEKTKTTTHHHSSRSIIKNSPITTSSFSSSDMSDCHSQCSSSTITFYSHQNARFPLRTQSSILSPPSSTTISPKQA
ncbi:unnamed protein product [Didymodactylos carnosus]|uniref:Tudor domain-containing protein n=1 Tax=Didymodactylos carnosus TaxID=1234261 RepID=A0A813VTB1_9BILA|nr:unnamed protein product [Didymodactylos carnosus]CAF3630641.1 unnamed protein product [Didymodactylos carnosus]